MRLSLWASAAGTLLAASATAAVAESLPGPAFPSYENAQAVVAACDAGLAGASARVTALEAMPPGDGWLAALDDVEAYVEDVSGPLYVLENVHPDKAIRDAAQACTLRWSEFGSAFAQNETVYRALCKVQPRDAIDRGFVDFEIEGFDDAGVGLAPPARERARQLNDRIAALSQQFGARIRDAQVTVPFTAGELAGVPEAVWKEKPRDAEGRYLFGLDYPTLVPVYERAEVAATRERMWRAKQNEGTEENLKVLNEISQLRRDYARLFGAASYADFRLRTRMARNTANTSRFLGEVKAAVQGAEQRDLAELRQAKADFTGAPLATTRLERWDVAFYTDRVRRARYAVDQEAFRRYFPPEASLRFVMRIAEKMFGIRYTQVPAKTWHADVLAFAVSDAASGQPLASLYVDLYPREGKYKHAAVWSFRNGATRNDRTPQAALVVNLDRQGLTLAELETLLHESGHALHNNLSKTRYAAQAGTHVQRDFVEAPSQMLEDWVYDKKVLKIFAEVCPTCEPVPDEMIDKALVARDYAKGIAKARQLLYATYDLALYGADAPEAMALWQKMEGATPVGTVPGTMFPAGFGHIVGGYASGYYSYLWSEVVALDLRTAFATDRLDPVVGMRYRNT
ncbi:MAG: M3 family metallopeptidase, partial [Caldimonas sp.]